VSRRSTLAHIARDPDGSFHAVWGPFALKSAFQPIFAFDRAGKLSIAAFEGLIRPFRGDQPFSPHAFFSGLSAIDRFPVETLTRTLHLYNAAANLPEDAMIFVNFDPSVFIDRAISNTALQEMREVLLDVGIDAGRVVCEVTEKRSASQEALTEFVYSLKANGFRIAVDDYGSEDSDIDRIKSLRPDIVKFDAYWITRLMESGPGFGLLRAMVEIFSAQDIATVFEGIEENWQLDLAQQSGASMVQGYVLARPELAPANFAAFRSRAQPGVARPLRPRREAATPVISAMDQKPKRTFGRKSAP
jgi:EAL domain-containing protein (putative c-di-GMP-specific phosphodiesterase class I)